MSSASLTSTEAVKHSNYHGSDRGGATTTNTQHCGETKTKHTNRLTHMLTLTTVLTNAHSHTRKIHDSEAGRQAQIILQPRKQKKSRSCCNSKWKMRINNITGVGMCYRIETHRPRSMKKWGMRIPKQSNLSLSALLLQHCSAGAR